MPGPYQLLLLIVGLVLAGCSPADTAPYEPSYAASPAASERGAEYVFAIHPLHNPKRLFEVYQPLVELINERADGAFLLKLEASRDYAAFETKLRAGKFAVALPNPYQSLQAADNGYRIVAKMGSDERFRGIIIVRRDANIAEVADLAGAAISFPAPTALAATMMPQLFLFQNGLGRDAFEARYVGSQESAIMNVLLGKTAAAGTWPPPWEAMLRRRPELAEQLKVRWQTDPLVNNGVVVHEALDASHAALITEVLLDLHRHERGQAILRDMEIARFEAADQHSFEPVRVFLSEFDQAFGASPP